MQCDYVAAPLSCQKVNSYLALFVNWSPTVAQLPTAVVLSVSYN